MVTVGKNMYILVQILKILIQRTSVKSIVRSTWMSNKIKRYKHVNVQVITVHYHLNFLWWVSVRQCFQNKLCISFRCKFCPKHNDCMNHRDIWMCTEPTHTITKQHLYWRNNKLRGQYILSHYALDESDSISNSLLEDCDPFCNFLFLLILEHWQPFFFRHLL